MLLMDRKFNLFSNKQAHIIASDLAFPHIINGKYQLRYGALRTQSMLLLMF